MRVLVACEYSGVVRDAFTARGHHAVSCDIRDSESPGHHYKGDVRDILHDGWDLLIAHPPCTFLSKASARWLYTSPGVIDQGRYAKGLDAKAFFMEMLNAPKGLPDLKPTDVLDKYGVYLPSNTGGAKRGEKATYTNVMTNKDRSRTFTGIADAMAEQWGGE